MTQPSDTPIGDQLAKDLDAAEEADLTHFEEDEDPLLFAGEFLEDEDPEVGS